MPIHRTISKWKNVTYQIEWYADGQKIFKEDPFCKPIPGQSEYDKPCPDNKEIRSLLQGKKYMPGKWVRIFR